MNLTGIHHLTAVTAQAARNHAFYTSGLGLRLVKKRGELMAQARDGGMMAVIGLGASRIRRVIDDMGLQGVDVASFNSPSQIVISGSLTDMDRAGPVLEKAGAKMCMPLQVSAAFHSRYMATAAREFAGFLGGTAFAAPRVPVSGHRGKRCGRQGQARTGSRTRS